LAIYAGLRRGELQALRVRNVDLDAGTISVEHGWDIKEGEILPKSEAGVRRVFLLDELESFLRPLVEGRGGDEFVFGMAGVPFEPRAMERKARRGVEGGERPSGEGGRGSRDRRGACGVVRAA
jgi:integrase